MNLRPIVGLWDQNYIYYNDIKLPYCGNMQFLRAYGDQGTDSEYIEGTADNRKVRFPPRIIILVIAVIQLSTKFRM